MSDTTGEFADQLADVKWFLLSLISDNTVIYNTDKNSRYYLDNAIYRLIKLSDSPLHIVDVNDLTKPVASEKDEWINAQAVFPRAVGKFGEAFGAFLD